MTQASQPDVDAEINEVTDSVENAEKVPSPEDDYKEKWQRAVADADNMRKRFEVERKNHSTYALESFLEELLPVVDNFYRATEHVPVDLEKSSWVTGILYIQKNLLDVLEKEGVQEIPVKAGDSFDPHTHEAIQVEKFEDKEEGVITKVITKGYRMHERILRPAQVAVSE